MRTLADKDLVSLWERGTGRRLWEQALLALAAALPQESCESLAAWPLGRRNQALMRLRCLCFGSHLRAWLGCAKCGGKLEFEMDAQLLAGEETGVENDPPEPVNVNGHAYRVPTSCDLALAAKELDPTSGARRIAESCLLGAVPESGWSEEELSAIGDKLALADPHAEARLTLECPDCGWHWDEPLDIASFFWSELEARVRRILFAVHTLASAYGWSETDILALNEGRRAMYLEMAQA